MILLISCNNFQIKSNNYLIIDYKNLISLTINLLELTDKEKKQNPFDLFTLYDTTIYISLSVISPIEASIRQEDLFTLLKIIDLNLTYSEHKNNKVLEQAKRSKSVNI